jgi:hypothetical protein
VGLDKNRGTQAKIVNIGSNRKNPSVEIRVGKKITR